MREEDISLQDQAAHIAGHAVLMRGGVRSFQRVPGLQGVEVVRFLDHCDLAQPKLFRFSSTIFDADRKRVHETFKKLYPGQRPPEGIFERLDDFLSFKETPYRLLRNTLAKAKGGYFLQTDSAPSFSLNPDAQTIKGHMVELTPLQTRQEVVASLAGLKGKHITQGFNFTQSELRKFVDMHELQHARSNQIWATDPSFHSAHAVPVIIFKNPAYDKLWAKARAIGDIKSNIEYARYLNENVSDTMAALMHLKAGGSIDLIQTVADARAAGLLNGQVSYYGSFRILDKIVDDSENVRAKLIGANHEEIENFAIKLAGEFSLDRNGYYTQKLASYELQAAVALRAGQRTKASYYMDFAAETALKLGTGLDEATQKTQRQHLLKRYDIAMLNLTEGPQLSHEEHKIEVLAAVKHAQDMHPEFQSPEGGQYLLKTRQRMAAKNNVEPLPTESQIHAELTAYYGRQQEEMGKPTRFSQPALEYEELRFGG